MFKHSILRKTSLELVSINSLSTSSHSLPKPLTMETNFMEHLNLTSQPFAIYSFKDAMLTTTRRIYQKQAGIYGWLCLNTGMIYVGQGVDLSKRPYLHLTKPTNPHLKRAFSLHGNENFVLFIFNKLGTIPPVTKEQLTSYEQAIVDRIPKALLYNTTMVVDSSLGYKHTPQSLIKMRLANLRENDPKFNEKLLDITKSALTLPADDPHTFTHIDGTITSL